MQNRNYMAYSLGIGATQKSPLGVEALDEEMGRDVSILHRYTDAPMSIPAQW